MEVYMYIMLLHFHSVQLLTEKDFQTSDVKTCDCLLIRL